MDDFKYKQKENLDIYRIEDAETGEWERSGRAEYYEDGTLKRLDDYQPSSLDGKHIHTWEKIDKNGNVEFHSEEHNNHSKQNGE